MLISIVEDYYDSGCLPDAGPIAIRGFFPNCNLALRRATWSAVDGYDEGLAAAEDMDLCKRASAGGWRLFFEPNAKCRHQVRTSVPALARQWWGYGVGSATVQCKTRDTAVELYVSAEATPRIHRFRRLWAIRNCPLKALVFATPFRAAVLPAPAAVAAAALGHWLAAGLLILTFLSFVAMAMARHPAWRQHRLRQIPGFLVVLVTIDLASLLGGLWGGLRNRMLYVLAVV